MFFANKSWQTRKKCFVNEIEQNRLFANPSILANPDKSGGKRIRLREEGFRQQPAQPLTIKGGIK